MASKSQKHQNFQEVSSVAENIFASKRLIYRAMETTDEDMKYIHEVIQCDPVNFVMSDYRIMKPQTREVSNKMTKNIVSDSFLAAMVCLPPAEDSSKSTSKDEGETESKKEDEKKPTPIGFVLLFGASNSSPHQRSATFGICIAKKYQGKGYGSEAVEWTVDWAFRHGNLRRVELNCFEYNDVARELYERAGFKLEGVKREKMYFNRKYWDEYDYAILERDWEKMRGLA